MFGEALCIHIESNAFIMNVLKLYQLSQELINLDFLSVYCLIIIIAKKKESNIRRGFFF